VVVAVAQLQLETTEPQQRARLAAQALMLFHLGLQQQARALADM
jgi:hypothetical protein